MTPFAIGILAVSMSVDAFLACVGKGAGGHRPDFGRVLRTGAIFGAIEAATPVIGWAAGMAASQYVAAVDHWIAFGLLFAVGARMVFHALASGDDAPRRSVTLWTTIATAVGTSVDAMAVGVSLAFLDVNIWLVALACGVTTMLMSTAGLMAGRFLGQHFRVWAEVAGGLALCGLGLSILITHLSGG